MDWVKLIKDLEDAGMTRSGIAAAVPCSKAQITDLANGKRGKNLAYTIADSLRNLHSSRVVCGCKSGCEHVCSLS
jgi:uncharacterized protein YwlG (UPF0340 family)